jgi:DNA primase
MRKYSTQFINQIRQALPLSAVVKKYTALDVRFYGLCPFHKEKTPSFHVSDQKGLWYCFGCHRGGDIFDFIQEAENLSFSQAVIFLAKEAGISRILPKSERFKSYKYRRAMTRKERLIILSELENAFIEYERGIADCLLFERRCLPYEKTVWGSMDYLEEQLLDNRSDVFNELRKRRHDEFFHLRRKA